MPRVAAVVLALLCVSFAFVGAQQPRPDDPKAETLPKSEQNFDRLDTAIRKHMAKLKAGCATVAVSKNGRSVYSQGYGNLGDANKSPTPPDAMMRIASLTKPITMALVRKAFLDGQLKPEDTVFDMLQPKFQREVKLSDERIKLITVQHLLDHKGGWDSNRSGDPMFMTRKIEPTLKPKRAATAQDVVEYWLAKPLEYPPGTREIYSNFGYCLLGRILELKYGKPYLQLVRETIADPLKIVDIGLGRTTKAKRNPREPAYPVDDGEFSLEVMDAHGGLIASAPAVCQFLEVYWLDGRTRKPKQWGDWALFGSLPGTTSLARQRKDGYSIVVLINSRLEATMQKDNDLLLKELDKAFDAIVGPAMETSPEKPPEKPKE